MSLPISLPDNPEESEIDRLLFELGIKLPTIEIIADQCPPAGVHGSYALIADSNECPHDEDETDRYWVIRVRARIMPRLPDTES